MKISEKTRPAKAGHKMASSLIETIHLLYLDDNALEYLQGLTRDLNDELERRKKEWDLKVLRKKKVVGSYANNE